MIIERLIVGDIQTNCYLVGCPETRAAAVVDPGAEGDRIRSRIESLGLDVKWVLLTHGHGDHIGAAATVKSAVPEARLAIHADDAPCLNDPMLNLSGLFGIPVKAPPADRELGDGDEVPFGTIRLQAIHVPGHTPGGVVFYSEEEGLAFAGDSIFAGGIGRADLPGGDLDQFMGSLRARLLTLPPETVLYPGHGESTTIGEEARSNPFLARERAWPAGSP